MHRIAAELCERGVQNPGEDIMSTLVHSELDGQPLSDQILGGIFVLFSTAGKRHHEEHHKPRPQAVRGEPSTMGDSSSRIDPTSATAVEELLRVRVP